VDVLGGALQLGKGRDCAPRCHCLGVINFQEQRLVGLDYQRPVGHDGLSSSRRAGRARQGGVANAGYTPTAQSEERTRADEILPVPDGHCPSPSGRVSRSSGRSRQKAHRLPTMSTLRTRNPATWPPTARGTQFSRSGIADCRSDVSQFDRSSPAILRGTLT